MRIGLVCPYSLASPGGVQNHVLGLTRYLIGRGNQVGVLAPGQLAGVAAHDQFVDPACVTSLPGAVPVPYNGSIARIGFGPVTALRVQRWLDAGGFDVVHVHEPLTPSASVLTLWRSHVPVVATFHTATPGSRTMHVASRVLRRSVRKIAGGVAVSASAQAVVAQHLRLHVPVVPNGLHVGDFANPPRDGWRGGARPRVSFLGRLDEPRKGLDVLLDALPLLSDLDIDWVIAGEGRRHLPASVRAVGRLPDTQRTTLLASSDVVVAPNRGRESFGLVLVEAMASGAAVVASDLPAFAAVLHDGEGPLGWTFPAGSSAHLAATVRTALDELAAPDPWARQRLERAAVATRRYDWSVVGPRIETLYRVATQPHPGPSPKLGG